MNYTKLAEKIVVTFVEAGFAYLALNNWNLGNKAVLAGAVGAGLSAVYNIIKQLNANRVS